MCGKLDIILLGIILFEFETRYLGLKVNICGIYGIALHQLYK